MSNGSSREGREVSGRERGAGRRQAGELESEVLAVLWAAPEPLVPAQVQEALGGRLAYNTVATILGRLYAKGAVTREQSGRAHAYSPVLDQAGMAARRMQAMLGSGADRAAVLRRFVSDLDGEDEILLTAALREASEAGGSATPEKRRED